MAACMVGRRFAIASRPASWHLDRWALFIDFDAWFDRGVVGTPRVPIRSLALLGALHERLSGALALMSRHPITAVDEFLFPLRAACAGLQGLERRDARGGEHRLRTDTRLAHVRSLPDARELVGELTLASFMAEEPFAGRRPLLFGRAMTSTSIRQCCERLGGQVIEPQRRSVARSDDAQFATLARSLLDDPLPHGPALTTRVDWTSPSTAQ